VLTSVGQAAAATSLFFFLGLRTAGAGELERFLYRLSKTPHRAPFVLEGALMLRACDAPLARDEGPRLSRPLGQLARQPERVIRQVCASHVDPEGMVFDPAR
jgi:hypothetical protein